MKNELDLSMNIRELLKNYTAKQHKNVEKLNFLGNNEVTRLKYVHFLIVFYKIVKPLEETVNDRFAKIIGDNFLTNFRTKLLERDLISLQVDTKHIKNSAFLPNLDNVFDCIGSLYVLEGSVLGGNLLYKKIIAELGEKFKKHVSFLQEFNQENMRQWNKFTKYLETFNNDKNENKLQIILAAENMFECFANEFKYFNKYLYNNFN